MIAPVQSRPKAGVTIEMGVQVPSQYSTYTLYLAGLVNSGKVSMATINNDVRHVLTLKYLAGLFAHPLTDPNRVKTAELTPASLAAARTMAGRSMVLLNNNNHALPLNTSVSSVAVVGPLADDPSDQLGPDVPIGYSASDLTSVVSVLNGIKAAPQSVSSAVANCALRESGRGRVTPSPPTPPGHAAPHPAVRQAAWSVSSSAS